MKQIEPTTEVALKKYVLKIFVKYTGNTCVGTSFGTCNLIKKGLQHSCFPVNFVKYLGTPFT